MSHDEPRPDRPEVHLDEALDVDEGDPAFAELPPAVDAGDVAHRAALHD